MFKKIINTISLSILFGISFLMICFAQQELQRLDSLKDQIKNQKTTENLDSLFKELMDIYAEDNKFNEFYNFLENLEKDKIFKTSPLTYYYQALARSRQIQFLEDNKMWQELFDNKELYAKDLNKSLDEAKKLSATGDPLVLKLKFLEWQLKKDNEKASINALEDLFNLAQDFAQAQNNVGLIKEMADELAKEKETNYAKKLYSVYVSGISKTNISEEELKNLADVFLGEGKVDLSVSLYGAYLEKIEQLKQDKNITIKKMFDIAEKFADSGWKEGLDPFFAERIYKKIDSLYNIAAFDEMSLYQRAYNLERSKEYESCVPEYLKLLNYPKYQDKDRIYFRLGVLSAYIFNNTDKAREYFSKVVNGFPQSQDYLNSLYHLGLLDHWQFKFEKAKEFYNMILEKTKDLKIEPEIAELAKTRIKEIDQNKDIEYNLRMFLGAVLKKEEKKSNLQIELFAKIAKDYSGQTVKFQTSSYMTDTGCLQQDFTYLWSGQLGTNQNPLNTSEFQTNYQDLGTKVVNVVLVGPKGVVGGTIEIADIYKK